MKKLAVLTSVLALSCSSNIVSPTKVEVAKKTQNMAYAINMPLIRDVVDFKAQFPNGVRLSPVAAQSRWDYTKMYGGTPNVYFGVTGPKCQNFLNTSIVIAPYQAASQDTFTSRDWPNAGLDLETLYTWVGQATLSLPAAPGTYVIDESCR